jgi:serine protease AprX
MPLPLHRVSVLVDGEREEQLARHCLVRRTTEDALNKYDGLLTGWATAADVAEMRQAGLQVEAAPAQEAPTGVDEVTPLLKSEEGLPVCIKLRGPMRPNWRKLIEENKVQMLDKVGTETYRVRASEEALHRLAEADMVQKVWVEAEGSKASPEVRQDCEATAEREGVPQAVAGRMLGMYAMAAADPDDPEPAGPPAQYDVAVFKRAFLHPVRAKLDQSPGVTVVEEAPRALRIEVLEGAPILTEIVKWPEVRFVSKHVPPRLLCTAGNATIGVTTLRTATPIRWDGGGEVVAVFDSGIDAGHPDLASAVQPALPMPGARPHDDIGHGTHVAGIIAGRGTAGGSPGVAPGAALLDRAMIDASGQLILPLDYDDLFEPAATAGAKIFNLSWGWAVGGSYDQGSRQVDEFAYAHPDILLVVAAGNSGRAPKGDYAFKTLAAPASAKNVLTVGACSLRCTCTSACACKGTNGEKWPSFFPLPPASKAPLIPSNGDPVGVIGISSRGPTDYDSIKPDVLAPGLLVESTRSQHVQVPRFEKGCPCADEVHYGCLSGTSMAAPFVAGAAALVRQYLREEKQLVAPSAALLKALLIVATIRLTHVREKPPVVAGFPDFDQGFGVLDLSTLLPYPAAPADRRMILVDICNDSPEALASRQPADSLIRSFRSHRFRVDAASAEPLRIVLCWTDPPGVSVQNNLQLDLKTPAGGPPLLGNQEHTFLPDPFGLDFTDKRNNVEVIRVPNPGPGEYRARVFAQNTAQPNQGYALVVIGPIQPAAET